MGKADSIPAVINRLFDQGVPRSSLRRLTGPQVDRTGLAPDLLVLGTRLTCITAVSTMRERWPIHDWRSWQCLVNLNDMAQFRANVGRPSATEEVAFYVVITEENDPMHWRDVTSKLSGQGVTRILHIRDGFYFDEMVAAAGY